MFDFIKNRFMFYIIAGGLTLISLGAVLFLPMNLGIDMTGGTLAEFRYTKPINLATLRAQAEDIAKNIKAGDKALINNITAYTVSGGNSFIIEAGFESSKSTDAKIIQEKQEEFKQSLTAAYTKSSANDITRIRYTHIGESFGAYIKDTAYLTLALVVLFISGYIAWAFRGSIEGVSSFSFAFVTAVSLFHDVLGAFGLYLITSYFFPEFKIDTFFITAMLTVLGYSVSDTIVIMDRIRYSLHTKEFKKLDFGALVNISIRDTLTRSIFTSLTVFLVLVCMFFFGPETIRGFVLAMLFGTVVGTYSSIAIAAPLLYDVNRTIK